MASDIRVAVIGVGNVGGTFIQGLDYYGNSSKKNGGNIGMWHDKVGGIKPSNIKVVSTFDIDPEKAGRTISEIASKSSRKYHDIRSSNVQVDSGLLLDKLPEFMKKDTKYATVSPGQFVKTLKKSEPDVVLNLISSGLPKTSLEYAKAAKAAGASFVNATPSKIANDSSLASKFAQAKLVLVGDDLLSQFGGTAFHKSMIDFMVERGVRVEKSYQLDVGGSPETRNTMDEKIKMMKRKMKTDSIDIEAPYRFESVAGTTEYTDFLEDSRNSYYWMSSKGFLGSQIIMDLTLRTNDGANSGNVLFDVIRAIKESKSKLALKKKVEIISAYGFKNPPKEYKIREAFRAFEDAFVP